MTTPAISLWATDVRTGNYLDNSKAAQIARLKSSRDWSIKNHLESHAWELQSRIEYLERTL